MDVFRILSLSFVVELNWFSCLYSSNYVTNFLVSTLAPIGVSIVGGLAMGYARVRMTLNMQNARDQVEDPDGLGMVQLQILHTAFTAAYRLTAQKYVRPPDHLHNPAHHHPRCLNVPRSHQLAAFTPAPNAPTP